MVLLLALRLSGLAGTESLSPALPFTAAYDRSTNWFTNAVLFKPTETPGNELTLQFAPLILQEVVNGQEPDTLRQNQFGSLNLSSGVLSLDRSRPAIYAGLDLAQLNGNPHARVTYLWCYSLEPVQGATTLRWQGFRLTLNLKGAPVIWEILADDSTVELIFVSQNLEAAAAAQFGKPLPGRRYSIERSLTDAPRTIVARIIDDAATPMGPILYLRAGTRSASTLICRCMAAQARHLLATTTYQLVFCPSLAADSLLTQAGAGARDETAFWPGDDPNGSRLEQRLRLPSGF